MESVSSRNAGMLLVAGAFVALAAVQPHWLLIAFPVALALLGVLAWQGHRARALTLLGVAAGCAAIIGLLTWGLYHTEHGGGNTSTVERTTAP